MPAALPYCSNPVDIGGPRWRMQIETEDWTRVLAEARQLGVLQLALTGGEPMLRNDLDELVAAGRAEGLQTRRSATAATASRPSGPRS